MKRFKTGITFLLLSILSLTPVLWFFGKGNVLINGIDTNFPLDPLTWFLRRLYVWTNFPNAGADFSSSTAGLFFHLVQVVPYTLGLSIQNVQIVSLIFWFALIIYSSYFLAKIIFPKKIFVRLLFVTLYSFNIFLFNTWENVKVANLSLVSAIPLGVSIVILLAQKKLSRQKALIFSSLVGIILSGAGINPSYFACFIFVLLIILIALLIVRLKLSGKINSILDFATVILPIILVNLFWILPTINFIIKNVNATDSIYTIGFTNWVNSLSANTSLLNVFRVQGAWDWYAFDSVSGLPLYIPYALNYFYKIPFIVFSFLLPALAIIALFLVAYLKDKLVGYPETGSQNLELKWSLYLSFSLMLVIGVFLGAGTYEPTGIFFRWLSDHVPFFTIFRSPWYIFTPLVTLSLSALTCYLFYSLEEVFNRKIVRFFTPLAIILIIVGNLLYSYPLVTGKIFRPDRFDGFFVKFPAYVFEAKNWLKGQDGFRVVSYPDDEIEQFSWGYRGIESILGLLSNTEVIFSPLNNPDSSVAVLIKEFYRSIKMGEISAATALAQKLNIGIVFEKGDQGSLSPSLPEKVKEGSKVSFGNWNFYRFPKDSTFKIYSPQSIFLGPIQKEGAKVVGILPKEGVLLNQKDTVVKDIDALKGYYGFILLSKNLQEEEFKNFAYNESKLSNRLISRDLSKANFSVEVSEGGDYNPVLERYKLEDFGIKVDEGLEIEIDGNKVIWNVENYSDSYLRFNKIYLSRGEHKISIKLKNENLVSGGDFNSGKTFEEGGYGEGKDEYSINEDVNGKFLQILNVNKANVSADFSVSLFDPFIPYYFELRYKQIYGNNANVVVLQGTNKTLVKAQTERLPNYPEWNGFSFYYEPVKTSSVMKVSLESPFTIDPLGTKILYDDLIVYKVFTNNLLFLKEGKEKLISAPNINFTMKSPTYYEGEVSQAESPHIIVFAENYSPDWELSIIDENGRTVKKNSNHFSSNLYSNAWYIDSTKQDYKFKIYYKPQNLFLMGLAISLSTIAISALIYFSGKFKGKKR